MIDDILVILTWFRRCLLPVLMMVFCIQYLWTIETNYPFWRVIGIYSLCSILIELIRDAIKGWTSREDLNE
jgi:uncharacterized integral membrane protein